MKNSKFKIAGNIAAFLILNFAFVTPCVFAQEQPPAPSAPRAVKVPAIQKGKLSNNLKIAAIERKTLPLVRVSLLLTAAGAKGEVKDGLANMTASLLTKGTKKLTATQIAEQFDFLGGWNQANTDWNSTVVSINVTSDKLDAALAFMSDMVLNATFESKEIELFKTQTNDRLAITLKQPASLADFITRRYTFGEHIALGTPESLKSITQADIVKFHSDTYLPNKAVLIFTGDISIENANALAKKHFGEWRNPTTSVAKIDEPQVMLRAEVKNFQSEPDKTVVGKILVVDMPNTGQAVINYAKKLGFGRVNCFEEKCQSDETYYASTIANGILGGAYSSRLNTEIRIKRGLSYGAGSRLISRIDRTYLLAQVQTKNETAAEVVELVATEINRLRSGTAEETDLMPRKLNLIRNFESYFENVDGLAEKLVELYTFGLSTDELNTYRTGIRNVSAEQAKNFAAANFNGGDIIIVGDAKIFMDDLKKRFPNQKIEIIPASDLDLNRNDLRRTAMPDGKQKP